MFCKFFSKTSKSNMAAKFNSNLKKCLQGDFWGFWYLKSRHAQVSFLKKSAFCNFFPGHILMLLDYQCSFVVNIYYLVAYTVRILAHLGSFLVRIWIFDPLWCPHIGSLPTIIGQILDQCYGPYKVHFIAQENQAGAK